MDQEVPRSSRGGGTTKLQFCKMIMAFLNLITKSILNSAIAVAFVKIRSIMKEFELELTIKVILYES